MALSANTAPRAPEKDEEVAADDLEFSFPVVKEATQDLHHTFSEKEKDEEVAVHDSEFSFPAAAKEASESKNPLQEASEDFTFPVLHPH